MNTGRWLVGWLTFTSIYINNISAIYKYIKLIYKSIKNEKNALIKHMYAEEGSKIVKIRLIKHIEFRFVLFIKFCTIVTSSISILGL